MATFSYVATDASGKLVRGKYDAASADEMIKKLAEKSLYCTSYRENKEVEQKGYKFKIKEIAFFCRQLSSMLNAGISLVKSVHILYSQEENLKAKQVYLEIYESLQKGSSFGVALSSCSGVFPNLLLSMIAAGESGGNLDMIMGRVADHFTKENKMKNKIKSSMVYPIILGILMFVVVIAMFTFVMPMFVTMFKDPETIPPLTKIVLAISDFMVGYWYICIAIVVGLIFGIRVCVKTPKTRYYIDKFICKSKKIGKLIKTIYAARFSRTMSNLFASGLLMVECIEKSEQTLGNLYISEKFADVIADVKRGDPLSVALARTQIFDGIFTSTIFVGEESGSLETILGKTAEFYDEEADTAISKLVAMLEPLMIIILGVMIALIIAAVFPALYGSFANIS